VQTTPLRSIRLAWNPVDQQLYYHLRNGDIYAVTEQPGEQASEQRLYTSTDHGVWRISSMAFADSTLYLVGYDQFNNNEALIGTCVRGKLQPDGQRSWETVFVTDTLPLSRTAFDHRFNALAIHPGGDTLYINSGSRTDHGESHQGFRELPLTSCIFQIPADATNLHLQNDSSWLAQEGYLFVDGVRNTFDLAFSPQGHLFGPENAGDRDDPEEINWLRKGYHYGFPWEMGGNLNPQQFPGYDPATDAFLNDQATAVRNDYFYNDPTFPPRPSSLTYQSSVLNLGPDAARWRNPQTFQIEDATANGDTLPGFTPHRSMLGLVFDQEMRLDTPYTGQAFVLSWTNRSSPLLGPFLGDGEDLLELNLQYDSTLDNYLSHPRQLVSNFDRPVDAELVGHALYVLEYPGENNTGIWKLNLPPGRYDAPYTGLPIVPDGQPRESGWAQAPWTDLAYEWKPNTPRAAKTDFEGRFKVLWDESHLYFLFEIFDDSLSDVISDPLQDYWKDDCLEIFLDEDQSGGEHRNSHQAFAYHLSKLGDAIDIDTDGQPAFFNDHLQLGLTSEGDRHYWEVALKVYDDSYDHSSSQNQPVTLLAGKSLGLGAAYCDDDGGGIRENFIGWQYQGQGSFREADRLRTLQLSDRAVRLDSASYAPDTTTSVQSLAGHLYRLFPNPTRQRLRLEGPGLDQARLRLTDPQGQEIGLSPPVFQSAGELELHLPELPAGIYVLQLWPARQDEPLTFRLQLHP
jgi:hypothetical protein